MKKSSVSRTRRFTYFQILCYAFERWMRTQNQILLGKNSWVGSKSSPQYRALDTIDGEPMEFEWNIFPGFTTLQLVREVQEFLSKMSKQPEEFTARIIFMSMFNDISWGSKDNEQEWELSANLVSIDARRFSPGRWSFLGPGSEKKLPRVQCPEERSKAKVVENYQYTSALMRERKLFFAQIFLLISSVFTEQTQICVKNTNPGIIEQGDLFWQDNLTHCLCQVWWRHLHLRPMILRKKICCKSTKNEWKGSHNKIVW